MIYSLTLPTYGIVSYRPSTSVVIDSVTLFDHEVILLFIAVFFFCIWLLFFCTRYAGPIYAGDEEYDDENREHEYPLRRP